MRGNSAVGPDEQRPRRRALAAVAPVTNWDRAADDEEPELLCRLGEEPLRGAVAERLDRGDALGIRRAEERKILGQYHELGALARGLADEPTRFAQIRSHVDRARHLHRRYLHPTSAGLGGMPFGGSSAHNAPSSSCSFVKRSTVGSPQLPVTQYDARPMP